MIIAAIKPDVRPNTTSREPFISEIMPIIVYRWLYQSISFEMSLSRIPEKCLVALAIVGGFILLIPIAKQASSQNTCIAHHVKNSSKQGEKIDSLRIMGSVRYCAGGS